MVEVEIFVSSLQAHMNQVYAGFELLKKEKEINLNYKVDLKKPTEAILKVSINGKKIVFDMADNSYINADFYQNCDFYIKRMLLKSDFKKKNKIIPYGFNYSIIAKNRTMQYLFLKNFTYKTIKYSIKYHNLLSRFLKVNDSIINASKSLIENDSKFNKPDQILFSARLWDPDRNDELLKKEERVKMNDLRINLVRRLKERYKNKFIGGISDDYLSRKLCPDIILSNKVTYKKNYLKELNRSTIAIATPGLEDSIGWKMGEYISNSCAIISSDISHYKLPGEFKEHDNYLKFSTIDECVLNVDYLLNNKQVKTTMMKKNFQYYSDFIEPSYLIRNIIKNIVNKK